LTFVVVHANPLATVLISGVPISVRASGGTYEITQFGVQKIHHVAPTVFAGFAGSIALGFRLIDDLDVHLKQAYDRYVPTFTLASKWASGVSSRLADVTDSWRSSPTSVVVAGMHLAPIDVGGHAPWGSGSVIHLPRGLDDVAEVKRFGPLDGGVAIGSGGHVADYQQFLTELDWVEISNWATSTKLAMSAMMQRTIAANPTPGISEDLIVMIMIRTPDGIVGRAMLGPLASNKALIARDERQPAALWQRFGATGETGRTGCGRLGEPQLTHWVRLTPAAGHTVRDV
jgi:hypothetical protein